SGPGTDSGVLAFMRFTGSQELEQVTADRDTCLVATAGEARPIVDVDQGERSVYGGDAVAHCSTENTRRTSPASIACTSPRFNQGPPERSAGGAFSASVHRGCGTPASS